MASRTKVTFTGPLFKADPSKTVRENIKGLLTDLAESSEQDIQAALRSGEGRRAPLSIGRPHGRRGHGRHPGNARVSRWIVGRVRAISGKPWALHAVVSPRPAGLTKKSAIALMAAASEIEHREHIFGKLTRGARIAKRDILKGLE